MPRRYRQMTDVSELFTLLSSCVTMHYDLSQRTGAYSQDLSTAEAEFCEPPVVFDTVNSLLL